MLFVRASAAPPRLRAVVCPECGHRVDLAAHSWGQRVEHWLHRTSKCWVTIPDDYHPWTGESCGCTHALHAVGLPLPQHGG